jgi:hypothetical protein
MVSGNTAGEKRARSWSRATSPNERITKPPTGEPKRASPNIDEIVDEWGRQSFPQAILHPTGEWQPMHNCP